LTPSALTDDDMPDSDFYVKAESAHQLFETFPKLKGKFGFFNDDALTSLMYDGEIRIYFSKPT